MMAGAGAAALSACGGAGDDAPAASATVAIPASAPAPAAAAAAAADAAKMVVEKSASGTVLPSASSILDDDGHVWMIVDDRVNMNGRRILTGSLSPIVLLLYFDTTIYAKNTDADWFCNGSPWTSLGVNDPRVQADAHSNALLFYGINRHMAWGTGIYRTMPVERQLALLQDLGVTMYRCDIADAGMARTVAAALKGSFVGTGVGILPVLNPRSAHWDQLSTEADAYALGYRRLAVRCMQSLTGLVQYIECGNELDTVGLQIGGDGSQTSDWSPQQWPLFRGVIRGMIDNVRAVDSTIRFGVNVGIPMAYRALQMLWTGVAPDGTMDGALPLRWDFTTYHWYQSSGDIECAGRYGQCVNIFQVLKDSFGVPIWLTEYGWARANVGPDEASAYLAQVMDSYWQAREVYDVRSIMMCELVDASFGLIQGMGLRGIWLITCFGRGLGRGRCQNVRPIIGFSGRCFTLANCPLVNCHSEIGVEIRSLDRRRKSVLGQVEDARTPAICNSNILLVLHRVVHNPDHNRW